MSDHNKHGEQICDHTDLPVDMCAHCHIPRRRRRHRRPDTTEAAPPQAAPTVVDLNHYTSLPYYKPATGLPTIDHGNPCPCGRAAGYDRYLCPVCCDRLETALANVPALIEDLHLAQQRATNTTTMSRRPPIKREPASVLDGWAGFTPDTNPDTPVTIGLIVEDMTRRWREQLSANRPSWGAATRMLDRLRATLNQAWALYTPTRGPVGNHDPQQLAVTMTRRARSIAAHPAAPAILNLVTDTVAAALALIDNSEATHFGYCQTPIPTDNPDTPTEPCDTPVLIPIDAAAWTCPRCHAEYSRAELEQWRIDRARDMLLTITELAALVGKTRDQVKGALRRHHIDPTGTVTVDGQPTHLYAATAYLDTL